MRINGKTCLNVFKVILTKTLISASTKKEAISIFESEFKGIKLEESGLSRIKDVFSTGIPRILNE